MATGAGSIVQVGELPMYYEEHGSGGIPLVLLHGGLSTIEVDFGAVLPGLAATRRVIAIEQQAHGHTPDIERPLTYETMADDTAALLATLGVRHVDVFGYSVGSGVAIELVRRHPGLVRRVVAAGGVSYRREGSHPGMDGGMDALQPEMFEGTAFLDSYRRVAPRPEDWPRTIARVQELDRAWTGYTDDEIQALDVPMLIIVGDSDIVQPEHVVQMFRLLGGGVPGDVVPMAASQLAILPGTTHITLVQKADWLVSMTTAFLDREIEGPAAPSTDRQE